MSQNYSPYDAWRLGLDEPEKPFCTKEEYLDEVQALEAIDLALEHTNDADCRKFLEEARKCAEGFCDAAEGEGIGPIEDDDGPDDDFTNDDGLLGGGTWG